MADIENRTTDVTVQDELGNEVKVAADALGNYRFYVDAILKGQQLADNGQIFVGVIDALNLGTGSDEKPVFLLKNPAASGQIIQLKEILLATPKVSGGSKMRYYRNPTITADGTALTEKNKKSDSITGVATAFSVPTISANGVKLGIFGAAGAGQLHHIEDYELRIAEGEEMLITLEPPSSNSVYSLNVIWSEVPV